MRVELPQPQNRNHMWSAGSNQIQEPRDFCRYETKSVHFIVARYTLYERRYTYIILTLRMTQNEHATIITIRTVEIVPLPAWNHQPVNLDKHTMYDFS